MKLDYEALLERALSKIPEKAKKYSKYEIPEVDSIIIGSKTVIHNFKEIADKLNRKSDFLLKYLVRELATSGTIEETRVVLQGKFTKEQIDKLIKEFVKNYVVCPSCGKFDTKIVKEGRLSFLVCDVCGAKNPVKSLS
ncbi:MAG: translation initiation factor IF-2 subunit beta [Candidatus Verstraetearchaeota archaeon]|jgi:translation initiation factor 2 subunit 2|nr:translation initiation factor IF-2 subunit beta [Candidatus Verstraetearchaeota archaeon]